MPNIYDPTYRTEDDPNFTNTIYGDRAVALADAVLSLGPEPMKLDEFQKDILRFALQADDNGDLRFRQVLVSMGRQNGKSTLAVALLLYLMLLHNAQPNVFAIASTLQQANIVYRRFSNLINSSSEVSKFFEKTTETRGIQTTSGGYLQVAPAKSASLQGHSLTSAVIDEVHLLKESTYDAVVIGSGQQKNSLIFAITTAGSEESVLLKRIYEQGKAGTKGLGVCIWEAPADAAVDDEDALIAANPALAEGRMSMEGALQEVAVLPEADAVRYKLNRFITSENPYLPQGKWKQMGECGLPDRPVKIVADIAPSWAAFSIACSWVVNDEIHTRLLASVVKPSYTQALDLLMKVLHQVPHTEVGVSAFVGNSMLEALRHQGVNTYRIVRRDDLNAPPLFYEAVMTNRIKHQHLPMLDFQMERLSRREEKDDYRLVRPNTSVDIDAAMAIVFASYLSLVEMEKPPQVF